LRTLQANLGYRCNQSCIHCHVAAGPKRTETMSWETMALLLEVASRQGVSTLDLTGGAPELNPHFRRLVRTAREGGLHVIDRCNLTVLLEPDQVGLAEFLADHGVEIVASLPCYLEENVDRQRGTGIFAGSLTGLRRLNELGYGRRPELPLSLVYNPQGPRLPPPQPLLETDYRQHLAGEYGIHFTRLLVLANMPIQRFGSTLLSTGEFDDYMALLKGAHQEENLDKVMCRGLISVDWQGFVYDCDFNQMLRLPLGASQRPVHLSELLGSFLEDRTVHVGEHCYGCTAGQGSSCGGALDSRPHEEGVAQDARRHVAGG
jgi:radical SAM/Cys-rich protein